MSYYAGIDGGQSSSICVLSDDTGRVLARVAGPPADLVGEPPGSTRQADVLDGLIVTARRAAGLAEDEPLASIVAGISGADADADAAPAPAPRTPNVRIVHDLEIAHAGAFDGGSGILVIAGTGSAALGIDDRGARVRCGGWGYFFGDEGSALWIARTALRFAMEEHDCGRSSAIQTAAQTAFEGASLRSIQHGFARGTIDRIRLAAFAPAILALSETDPAARLVIEAAARALAELAAIAGDRLVCSTVSYSGGLFTGVYTELFRAQVRQLRPALRVVPPLYPPEIGALLLARRSAAAVAAR